MADGCAAKTPHATCLSRASKISSRRFIFGPSPIHLQRRDKSFLRNLDLAELPHLLLARLLLFQQLALAGDVAAIAFRGHILAQRPNRLPRDDLSANPRPDRDLEHVLRDQLLEL